MSADAYLQDDDEAPWLCDACVVGRCDICCVQVGGDCDCGCVTDMLSLRERLRLLDHPSFAWTQGQGWPADMPFHAPTRAPAVSVPCDHDGGEVS